MSVFNSISVAGLIVLLVAGLLIGLGFSDTDLLNPDTAAAEANRIEVDTQHQLAMNQLQERLSAAKTEAEIQAIQLEQDRLNAQYQFDLQAMSQRLAHQEIAFRTWMTVLIIISGAFALTLFFATIIWVGARAWIRIRAIPPREKTVVKVIPPIEKRIPNLSERGPYDPWSSPAYRRSKRNTAQEEERRARMKNFRDPGRISPEEYNNSPKGN